MIKGIGADLVSIPRIEQALAKHGERFAEKILTTNEYKSFLSSKQKYNFLAKRFAAKEAAVKALGTGFSQGIGWKDIGLSHDEHGKPELCFINKALERYKKLEAEQVLISISDEESLVIAYVIIE